MKNWMRQLLAVGGGAAWTPPSGCLAWWSAAKSGAVAPLGVWQNQAAETPDAQLAGNAFVSATTGYYGDGAGDYALIQSAALVGGLTSFTLCAWVTRFATGLSGFVYGEAYASGPTIALSVNASNKVVFQIKTSGWYYATSTGSVGTGITHIAAVLDAAVGMQVYIGGSADGSNANKSNQSWTITAVVLGAYDGAGAGSWKGSLDRVLIFNRALSAPEVADVAANS